MPSAYKADKAKNDMMPGKPKALADFRDCLGIGFAIGPGAVRHDVNAGIGAPAFANMFGQDGSNGQNRIAVPPQRAFAGMR